MGGKKLTNNAGIATAFLLALLVLAVVLPRPAALDLNISQHETTIRDAATNARKKYNCKGTSKSFNCLAPSFNLCKYFKVHF